MARLPQIDIVPFGTYDTSTSPVIWRTHHQIANLFGDFDLLDPGLTWTPSHHPEETGSAITPLPFTHPSELRGLRSPGLRTH